MEQQTSTREVLTQIDALLGRASASERSELPAAERLELVTLARRVSGRVTSLTSIIVAEADSAKAAERTTGRSSGTWLADREHLSGGSANGIVLQAKQLAEHPQLRDAALAGDLRPEQGRAAVKLLDSLSDQLSGEEKAAAELVVLAFGKQRTADQISHMAREVLETVRPDTAEQDAADRLERQRRQALRDRFLTLTPSGEGSVILRGSLPVLEAEVFNRILDAHAESHRRQALDRLDPQAEYVSGQQRRADALLSMIEASQHDRKAPSVAGDRPRLVITMTMTDLLSRAPKGLLTNGDELSAGELRRALCDADLMPAVLGGPSTLLDIGRSQRLVTPAIRRVVDVRDAGCAFPGCDTPSVRCEAHHIIPWWAGGETALHNLVLLCPHHHGLCEPIKPPPWHHEAIQAGVQLASRQRSGRPQRPGVPTAEQRRAMPDDPKRWSIRIADDGVPEAVPPRYSDPDRRPRRHHRYEQASARSADRLTSGPAARQLRSPTPTAV